MHKIPNDKHINKKAACTSTAPELKVVRKSRAEPWTLIELLCPLAEL